MLQEKEEVIVSFVYSVWTELGLWNSSGYELNLDMLVLPLRGGADSSVIQILMSKVKTENNVQLLKKSLQKTNEIAILICTIVLIFIFS